MRPVKMTMEEAISHGMQSLMEQALLFDVKPFLFLLLFSFAASKMPVVRLNLQCHCVLSPILNALDEDVLYLFFLLVWTSLCLCSGCSPVVVTRVKKRTK